MNSHSNLTDIAKQYTSMNRLAEKSHIVFFGSDILSRMQTGELSDSFRLSEIIYNRSLAGATLEEATTLLEPCVLEIVPQKVFLEIGDTDIQQDGFDADMFLSRYEWMLYTIHCKTHARIYILSVREENRTEEEINRRLKKLAEESGCKFIDITKEQTEEDEEIRVFERLLCYLRNGKVSFCEAMMRVTAF